MEKFYAYATGKKGEGLGLNYTEFGLIAFTDKNKARDDLDRVLSSNPGLEGEVINLTPLVQKGIIPRDKLYI